MSPWNIETVPESSGNICNDQYDLLYEKDSQHANQKESTRPPRILEGRIQSKTPKYTVLKLPSQSQTTFSLVCYSCTI